MKAAKVGLLLLTHALVARFPVPKAPVRIRAIMGLLVWCCGALAPLRTVAAHGGHTEHAWDGAQERQIIQGDNGWELEIHASPMPATAGDLLHLALWLRKDGAVFPGMTAVSIEAVNLLAAAQTVVETRILARQGSTAQSLQLYEGGLYTIAVTVRPVDDEARGVALPTAVLSVDVLAPPPPLTVQLRMLALVLGVLVVGMGVGFFWPHRYATLR